jgi:hypothetical protein
MHDMKFMALRPQGGDTARPAEFGERDVEVIELVGEEDDALSVHLRKTNPDAVEKPHVFPLWKRVAADGGGWARVQEALSSGPGLS